MSSAHPAPRGVVPIAAVATFLVLVAFTSPLATLTGTAAALGAGPEGQAWILSSMSIGLGVALLPAGALADDHGRRRALVLGAVVLALASAASALSPSGPFLVAARIVAGVGGAAVVVAGLGALGAAFPPGSAAARTASGIWGASLGAGIAAGPLLATGLERLGGWPAVYVVTAVAAAVLAVVGQVVLTESRSDRPRGLDAPGVLTLSAGVGVLLTGLVEARTATTRPLGVGLAAAGLVLLAAFALVERRRARSERPGTAPDRLPMLEPGLFGSPAFVAATVAALASGAGIIATTSFLPTVVERGLGSTALVAALLLLAWSGTSIVTSLLARRLPARVGGRLQLGGGLAVIAVGQLLLLAPAAGDAPWRFLPGLLLAGAASGVVNAALGREAVASVPAGRAAMGSGVNNTARYVGSAIGVTVVAVVATRPGTTGLLEGWNAALLTATVFSLLGALAVAACRPRPAEHDRTQGGAVDRDEADSGDGQGGTGREPGTSQAAVP